MTALHEFAYDPFQQRAIELIDQGHSVLVTAPTGAGKTVIADYVIAKTQTGGGRVIYTAPVKALSNQKFREFNARSPESVGIMTGDVTINPQAPILIMTTEIYRNTLLENPDRLADCSWIIFDEIHYLDDPERGTVWEEALMFTPPHIRILALSATIPNIEELAAWIRDVHERPVEVVAETKRPVPLHVLFQSQNKILKTHTELKQLGYLGREDWRNFRRQRFDRRHGDRWQAHNNRLDRLIQHLQDADQLPCIFFAFSRRRVEDLAWEATGFNLVTGEEQRQLTALYRDLVGRYQLQDDPTAQALASLIARGAAFHHAGMLPTLKEIVERCFTSRLIKLIFTTETFALGINMPARSVVLDSLKKRADGRIVMIQSRMYSQMAGRAGRRGMDEVGYVYLRVTPTYVTYPEVMHILHSQPERVMSRFNSSYATLLNLYRRHRERVLDIFPNTFYYFQTTGAKREAGRDLMRRKLEVLHRLHYLTPEGLTAKGEFGAWLYGYELLLTELHVRGHLEALDAPSLCVLLLGAVHEARPGLRLPKITKIAKRVMDMCREPLSRIHGVEDRLDIHPLSKAPCFHLAPAMEAWFHNAPFERLSRLGETDDGEIVRYFRMTVQLLRQLVDSPATTAGLRKRAELCLVKINRDVVDAEQQLRLG